MKKLTLFISSLILLIGVTGCGMKGPLYRRAPEPAQEKIIEPVKSEASTNIESTEIEESLKNDAEKLNVDKK